MPFYRGPEYSPEYYYAMKRLSSDPHPLEKTPVGYTLTLGHKGLGQLDLAQISRQYGIDKIPQDLYCLNLIGNSLGSLPDALAHYRNLNSLFLPQNHLAQVPDVIWRLTNLKYLDLSDNQITTIPECIAVLENLKSLELAGNPLTKLPQALAEMPSLEVLEIPKALQYDPILPLIPNLNQLKLQYGSGVEKYQLLFGQDLENHLVSITGLKTKCSE